MFHKQKDGFQTSWVLAIHPERDRWGMRAGSDERVVGVNYEHGWDTIPEVPKRILGTSGPNMWVWERKKERNGGMDDERGSICQQLKRRDKSHRFPAESTVRTDTLESWCKQYLMVKTSQTLPPLCSDKLTTVYPNYSQLMQEGGGERRGTYYAKGSSGRWIHGAGFTPPSPHTCRGSSWPRGWRKSNL